MLFLKYNNKNYYDSSSSNRVVSLIENLQPRLKHFPRSKCAMISRDRLFATPQTAARQAPLSMEFSKQEYWSGLPFPSISLPFPGDLPNPGIKPGSPTLQADSLPSEPSGKLKNIKCTYKNVRGDDRIS